MGIWSSCWLTVVGLRLNRAISLGESVAASDLDLGLNIYERWRLMKTQKKVIVILWYER